MPNAWLPRALLLWLLAALAWTAHADVPPPQRREVDHLLAFIRQSSCVMERNGTTHPAEEAYDHVLKKYDYFRDRIASTEGFIEHAATRSTVSGRPYRIRCGTDPAIPAKDWLLAELARYRASGAR